MKISIMQPYFLPYIGYFQLLSNADKFVTYDDVEYSKNSWGNRNRFGDGSYFTIPVERGHNADKINMKKISDDWEQKRDKYLKTIRQLYAKAPNFIFSYPIIEDIFLSKERNLFKFILQSLFKVCNYLMITTPIVISSSLCVPPELRSYEKVVETCKKVGSSFVEKTYINSIGGTKLYRQDMFGDIKLQFIKTKEENCFSILDLIMRFHREELLKKLENFEIIEAEEI